MEYNWHIRYLESQGVELDYNNPGMSGWNISGLYEPQIVKKLRNTEIYKIQNKIIIKLYKAMETVKIIENKVRKAPKE